MLLDGDIPAWMRPWIGWAVGMDWPQADESRLFALADALVQAAYRIAEGSAVWIPDRDTWDGEALRAFAKHASRAVGGRRAEVITRLVTMAIALNDLGVQVQYTKWMIKLMIGLLIVQLVALLPVLANPATAGLGVTTAGWRALLTRKAVEALARRLMFNIGLFGGLMFAMDLTVQSQQERRDRIDWNQALASLGAGALNGVFLTGTTLLAPPRTLLGFMGASGAAGGLTDATMQAFDDQPFDLERLLKGVSSGAIGAADAHWATWNPHFGGRGADGAPPPPDGGTPPRPDAGDGDGTPPRPDDGDGGTPPHPDSGNGSRTTLADHSTAAHTGREPGWTPADAVRTSGDRPLPHPAAADPRPGPAQAVPAMAARATQGDANGPAAHPARREPPVLRADQMDDKLNWGHARPADPPRTPYEFSQVAGKKIMGAWEPAGDDSARVTLADGSHAMVTDLPTRQDRDAKVLMARLGQELGLNTPAVHPVGEKRLLLDWVYGDPGQMTWNGGPWNLSRDAPTRDSVLVGLMGALIRDEPAFANALSGDARLMPAPAVATLMSRFFVRDMGAGQEVWAPNPLTPADALRVEQALQSMRADFRDAGMMDAYRRMTAAVREIKENAVRTHSVFKVDPAELLPEISVRELNARAEHIAELVAGLTDAAPPGAGRTLMDPVRRLADNIGDIVASRDSDLGRVVTFGDGSQALALTGEAAAVALDAALTGRVLGLHVPAVHRAPDGTVYQAHGSDQLRTSLATGIRDSSLLPTKEEVVTFNDGSRAIRHEFRTAESADELEARVHALHGLRDGHPGTYRAAPTVVYESRVSPWQWTDDTPVLSAAVRQELDRRALHAWLTRPDLPPGMLRDNPRMEHLKPGAALLDEADSSALRARFEAARADFERYGLSSRLEEHLDLIGRSSPDAALDLGPLRDPGQLVPDFRETPWQPPRGQVSPLRHLLEETNLHQVNELAVGRAADPALVPAAEAFLDRADAELAAQPMSSGHVSARVPADWLPPDVRPGSEVVFHGMLEGVDDPARLADRPDSVRLTIRASRYADVGDLSGKPSHALFGLGTRLKVLAVQEAFGERHLFAVQVPDGRSADATALRVPRMKPPLTPEVRHHLEHHVERTDAGVWLRDLDNEHDRELVTSARNVQPIDGVFYVDGHGSQDGNAIGDRTPGAKTIAALLLHSPGLKPHDVILLANCHIGTGRYPLAIARHTGHVVIAADSAIVVTEDGQMRAVSSEFGHLGGRGRIRIYLPDDAVAGQVLDTVRAWFQAP
ncbi:hypothetical protein [Nonomuraea indica]|uniref:WXG100-like domain-containing protein n=1 Tax=Nonomuraea indica TaxID=1581193 RepID=UPI000C7A04E5|nr:hypothetical protein [Nonomuraea indica]